VKMNIEYQCTLGDYQEAVLAHGLRSTGRKILYAVGGCFISTFVVFLMVIRGIREGTAFLGVIVFWFCSALVGRLVCPLWIKRDFRKHPNFSRRQVLRVNDDGLHAESEIGQCERKWLAYTQYRETSNLFILYLGARLFEVIPKRAFVLGEGDEFRELLRQKLPAK
jgi:YcxB-like protein